jgi:hypothetical protein
MADDYEQNDADIRLMNELPRGAGLIPSPAADLTTRAGLQAFRVLVRKSATGGTDPACTIELYENGALLATLISGQAVSSATGTVLSGTWDATSLAAISGADVECRVFGARSGGNPANRRALEIGAIEWNADYTEAGVTGTLAATETSDNAAVAGNVNIAGFLAAGESADTSAMAGDVGIAGSLAANEASDIAAITGNLANDIAGTLAATEAADMAAIAGAMTIAGISSGSEPIDIAAFPAALDISGSLVASEAPDMAAMIGTLPGAGNAFAPWIYQTDACRRGAIVAEGRRHTLTLDVVFDPVKAETT